MGTAETAPRRYRSLVPTCVYVIHRVRRGHVVYNSVNGRHLSACVWTVSAIANRQYPVAFGPSMISNSEQAMVVAIVCGLRVRYTLQNARFPKTTYLGSPRRGTRGTRPRPPATATCNRTLPQTTGSAVITPCFVGIPISFRKKKEIAIRLYDTSHDTR